ncbi:uncharacterized protein LOC132952873 isoform X3 [Metopolophium dirhodum]|uniref:uncharacterized protein LOC132952873 isoform X3 n=1 Tax=Metopolophium dirhodum TaxID=44670 RepID=UPI00298FDA3E|nr:uncharacterized protein LOC132952873 isoform X3 [Metopolophium dirhodum]
MWLIRAFWRLGGVFTIDLSYNKFQNAYSALLIATCVYNFVNASQVICKVDHWCSTFSSTLTAVYDRVLTSAVFFSRIAVVYECKPYMSRYRATIRAFEAYSPPSPTELRRHRAFSLAVVATCLAVIVPTNSICMYYLYRYEPNSDASLFVYQLFMYVQNLSMCCIETQFVVQCFKVYTKFHGINDDLKRLKDENLNRSEYPYMSSTGSSSRSSSRSAVVYDKDFYRPRFMSCPTANTVELLRIKHWLIRLSIDALNNLFGVHMGLSVFYLWLMALFDIYYEMFYKSRSGLLVYCWLLQYTLRLLLIILMAHFTTRQALEAKSLIADTNNGTMDSSTKEEAIAAGATCLVILVQFHSERN